MLINEVLKVVETDLETIVDLELERAAENIVGGLLFVEPTVGCCNQLSF